MMYRLDSLNDSDGDGVCDEFEVVTCQDESCEYDLTDAGIVKDDML